MADGQGLQTHREIFVGGRARALLNAIANFKSRRVGRGRVGRGPNLRINNDRGVTRQEVGTPHGRANALNTLVPGLGGLSSWRGRGRCLSFPIPTTPPSTPPQPLDRGFPLPYPPTSPPPLEDCSPPMRHWVWWLWCVSPRCPPILFK